MADVKRYQHIAPLCEHSEALIRMYPMATVYVRGDDYDAALARIAELEAENESLRKDAERYRWLRRNIDAALADPSAQGIAEPAAEVCKICGKTGFCRDCVKP